RWVDVYPNRGKRDGAFCSHAYGYQPQIMMSYADDLGATSTLAHELGHAMHDVLMDSTQPIAYTDVSMVAAETASNFNQALVRRHLLSRFTTANARLDVLDEAFGNRSEERRVGKEGRSRGAPQPTKRQGGTKDREE